MANEFAPRKAQKQSVKLKIAIQGPSGSGKTEGALSLAKNLVPGGKVLVIDTENESASLYADRYEFDTVPLAGPYTSDRYKRAMQVAVDGGYDVLVVDSITHQWDGVGGILRRKEEMDRIPGSNGYTNWAKFTPEHTAFVEFIKQIPVHAICTMRTKQAYVLEQNDKGKQTPRKMGMDPIQRDGMDYEFTLVFDVGMHHRATAGKNRTTLFQDDQPIDLCSPVVAESIREWQASGVVPPAASQAKSYQEVQAKPVKQQLQESLDQEPPVQDEPPASAYEDNGAFLDDPNPRPQDKPKNTGLISEAQAKRFKAIAMMNHKDWRHINNFLGGRGYQNAEEMPKSDYDFCVRWAEGKE